MSWHALYFLSHIQQSLDTGLRIIKLLEIRALLHRALDGHTEMTRDQLGYFIHFSKRNAKHSTYIPYCCPRSHRSERNNLGNMLCSVFLYHV
ncbi:hypothetical protein D1872_232370 [compost metagenome]